MKFAILALLLALTSACRKAEPRRGPIIVLRFENLTGDPALDWMARGASRQIAAQLEDASAADSSQPSAERERAIASGTRRILHGYVSRQGDRLRLRADLEDAGSFPRSAESTGPLSAGLVSLADAVSRQLDAGARPFGAANEKALQAYIDGLNAPDGGAAVESLSRAVAADANFGEAYVALVQLSLARQDREGAERSLAMARARGEAIPPIHRARLDVAAAQLSGNPASLSKSLAALSLLTPADSALLRTLAESELAAKRYTTAIDYFKKALALHPGDAALLNTLGYAQAYAGNLDDAVQSLREYERARPNDANPLDSLGDVHFYRGRFAEAEKYYRQAYAKDAAFQNSASLMKAAIARLFTGDLAGGETVFAEYEASRRAARDPFVDLTRARWDYFRGKRREAIGKLRTFAEVNKVREMAAVADCTLTVWLMETGDSAKAATSRFCGFLTRPDGARFPLPIARAYALLLTKDFKTVVPLLREILAREGPNPTAATPVLLAWALVETGNFDEAGKYLEATPVPNAPAPDAFEALVFPRIFHLRGRVAEKKGARTEAEQNDRLFKILSGS